MNRAKMWALLAGMCAGLVVGPGCMTFDEYYDDEYVCDRDYHFPESRREAVGQPIPDTDARPTPAVP